MKIRVNKKELNKWIQWFMIGAVFMLVAIGFFYSVKFLTPKVGFYKGISIVTIVMWIFIILEDILEVSK